MVRWTAAGSWGQFGTPKGGKGGGGGRHGKGRGGSPGAGGAHRAQPAQGNPPVLHHGGAAHRAVTPPAARTVPAGAAAVGPHVNPLHMGPQQQQAMQNMPSAQQQQFNNLLSHLQ
eukprot:4768981-Karenia_brevis.AAC.1